jgi:general secretion pathway protein G
MKPETKDSKRRKKLRAAQTGMTLIEIMIVVIIMAMIATGVAVAVMPQYEKSQINAAKTDVAAIRNAVNLYRLDNPGECPSSVDDLVTEEVLDKNTRTVDPWKSEFVINCSAGEEPDVLSLGPDMQEGTEDDIH